MQKTPGFDAELRPYTLYKEFLWQSKGMQKTPDFDAKLRPYKTIYKEFLWQSKGMEKTPDFDAKLRPYTKNSYGSQQVCKELRILTQN